MAQNQIVTEYDDAGIPIVASKSAFPTATGVIKTAPGRLVKIVVTVAPSAAVTFFDNALSAAGNTLFVVPSAAVVGTVYDVNMPALAGIYASFAGTGTLAVGYA
jgi:hypothetical protein